MQKATNREASVKCAWCQENIGVNDQYYQIDAIPITIWHIECTPNARFRRFGKDRMFTGECRKQLAMEHNKEV